MGFPLSPQTIEVLVEVISGGPAYSGPPPVGIYRSGPRLESFMRRCNVDFQVTGSRVPSLVECLLNLNRGDSSGKVLTRIVEAAADPRDFMHEPDKHQAVVDFLNRALVFDELELQRHGPGVRLVELGRGSPAIDRLTAVAETISFDTVKRDLDRALSSTKDDPEDAVTAACSTIESVCRSILFELDEPLPAKKDLKSLYNAVRKPLGLAPERSDFDPTIAADVRTILGGLATVIDGIGALRSHGGDAHGRERGYARLDGRIASLAVHAASTLAVFLLETWQRKFPARELHRHQGADR